VNLEDSIRRRALELGFHAIGFTRVEPLDEEIDRLQSWLDKGYHAEMRFMERWIEVRRDPAARGMLRGARTVVCLAVAYSTGGQETGLVPHIARYARGPDYHGVLRSMLLELQDFVRSAAPSVKGRVAVDTAPILERAWAARAGLGWIGRNSCLIHPSLGSWLVLGELVLSAELETTLPVEDRCGECRLCVEACPTGALARPHGRELDARRCLSYWTVEAREPPPSDMRIGGVLFGCDACQVVCPWNKNQRELVTPLVPFDRWGATSLSDLASADDTTLTRLLDRTPMTRAGPEALRLRAGHLLALRRGGPKPER
jgi:epoxyqueuosine reductase